jgi:Pyruvate/2-oxoacid:ferredoxin oxidoreductase gamma subunit
MKLSLLTVALAASVAVACGSSPPPAARYAATTASVRAAHEVGAEKVPDAQLHLAMAEDQLAQAKRLMNDGDNEKASWLLARAQSDADLAVALAREADTRASADQVTAQVRAAQERRTP